MKQYVKAVCGVIFCLFLFLCKNKKKALCGLLLSFCLLIQMFSVSAEEIVENSTQIEMLENQSETEVIKDTVEEVVNQEKEESVSAEKVEETLSDENIESRVEKRSQIPSHILYNKLQLPTVVSEGIPSEGDVVTGSCYIMDSWMIGIQSYFNVGNFTGDLAECYAVQDIHCMDPTAAEPNQTSAAYTATITEINKVAGYIEYSVYITPPGVTDGVSRDPGGCLYGYQHIGGRVRVNKAFYGTLELNKSSSVTDIVMSSAYSLQGAVYAVYDTSENEVGRISTDADGKGVMNDIPAGKYTVKEVLPPKGFLKDNTAYSIEISVGNVTTLQVQDEPQMLQIELHKVDSEMSQNKPQGTASLEGAEYEILNENNEVVEKLITNAAGDAVSSQLPLGNYVVKEVQSSVGYLLDQQAYKITGEAKDSTTKVLTYPVTSKEDIIRGNVEIIKIRENDKENDTLQGLENVEFTITSDTTGEVVKTITTDSNGFATTTDSAHPRGGLIYDSYTITETKTPAGLKPIAPFKVTISQDNITLKGIYKEDKIIVSPISIVKKDKSTGKTIPLAGTKFRLLDADKIPVTMTTYYPNKVVNEIFETDEKGQFTFPEKLKWGQYYLEEVLAPYGYLKGELVSFEVTEDNTWDNPMIIEFADENAMGQIEITKVDSKSKELLDGAVFEIRAAEDIITNDGTIRLKKGETAETVTVENGKAITSLLFLGKYEVIEIEQPTGYVLSENKNNVTLEYKDQNTPIIKESLTIENDTTDLVVLKKDEETKKTLTGVTFRFWKDDQEGETYVTNEQGEFLIQKIEPGNYHLQEIETLPGYVLDETVLDVKVDENGKINGQNKLEVEMYNSATKLIKTTAAEQTTGQKEIESKKECILIDKVEFQNLQIGQQYTVQGILMNKQTGEPLIINGKNITGETTFIAKEKNGTIEVIFKFDASELKNQEIVVFEKVYVNGIEILTHEDLNDQGQTVSFREKVGLNLVSTGDISHSFVWIMVMLCVSGVFLFMLSVLKKHFYKL